MATRTRKKKKLTAPPVGKIAYAGTDQDGGELFPPSSHAAIALSKTQRFAERTPEAQTYFVTARYLFGDPVDLYKVERTDDGTILTYTLAKED